LYILRWAFEILRWAFGLNALGILNFALGISTFALGIWGKCVGHFSSTISINYFLSLQLWMFRNKSKLQVMPCKLFFRLI
jgi:hypothetical protein